MPVSDVSQGSKRTSSTRQFRQVFYAPANNCNRTELLRNLWREHPTEKPSQIKIRLAELGYSCSEALIHKTRNSVLPPLSNETPSSEKFTLEEIRAVRKAAEFLGGWQRFTKLVAALDRLSAILKETPDKMSQI